MTEIDIDGKKYLPAVEAGARLHRSTAWLTKKAAQGELSRMKWGCQNVYAQDELDSLAERLKEEEAQKKEEVRPELLKIPAVAELLGVTRGYVWQMVDRGEIDYVDLTVGEKKKRGGLRIARAEVERLILARSHKRK